MARSKPYGLGFAAVDLALLYIFTYFWLAVIVVREIYRRQK